MTNCIRCGGTIPSGTTCWLCEQHSAGRGCGLSTDPEFRRYFRRYGTAPPPRFSKANQDRIRITAVLGP